MDTHGMNHSLKKYKDFTAASQPSIPTPALFPCEFNKRTNIRSDHLKHLSLKSSLSSLKWTSNTWQRAQGNNITNNYPDDIEYLYHQDRDDGVEVDT